MEMVKDLLEATKEAVAKNPPEYYLEWNGKYLEKKWINHEEAIQAKEK